jgi:signal transduction histidine kinase
MRSALRERTGTVAARLAGASILLAAAWLYEVLSPAVANGTISGRDGLRVLAYGLIVSVAMETRGHLREAETAAVAARERSRLARDLHDGIAQDLAFIATYGDRLAGDLGPDHPLVVAARRALKASRGAISDLSATWTSSTSEALRAVAGELSARHGVKIMVEADDHAPDLSAEEREEVVRIAREAMVNAVKHGGARTIVIGLRTRGRHLSLVIKDDGCGLDPRGHDPDAPGREHRGQGLVTMRERAAAIGGRLTIHQRPEGGTAVEVSV